jgi:hypothetical protein
VEQQTRFLIKQKINHMDITTVILATLGIASLVGLAWMGGYELGSANATAPRKARPTVTELVGKLNKQKPRTKRRASK